MNAIFCPTTRRGVAGRSTPNLDRTAAMSSPRRPLRAAATARPGARSSLTTTPGHALWRPEWPPAVTAPARAERNGWFISATQALPGGVVEHGMANLDSHVGAAHGIAGAHPLSVALG